MTVVGNKPPPATHVRETARQGGGFNGSGCSDLGPFSFRPCMCPMQEESHPRGFEEFARLLGSRCHDLGS
jgi:hypothetical protein